MKAAREALGLTAEEAASLLEIRAKTVFNLEAGHSGNRITAKALIAAYAEYAAKKSGELAKLDLRPEILAPDLFRAVAA